MGRARERRHAAALAEVEALCLVEVYHLGLFPVDAQSQPALKLCIDPFGDDPAIGIPPPVLVDPNGPLELEPFIEFSLISAPVESILKSTQI